MATTTERSPLLDIVPPELRLHIYEHLLTTEAPLKGIVARGDEKYNLHTAIMRVSKQIYEETQSIFFSRNTFYVSSLPAITARDEAEGSGAFEPPLQLKHLTLVRHLQIDLLYYPKILRTIRDSYYKGSWKPVCPAAERYVTSLSYLLGAVKSSLLSLKLCADTRRYIQHTPSSNNEPEVQTRVPVPMPTQMQAHGMADDAPPLPVGRESREPESSDSEIDSLNVKKMLTGFHMADTNPRFLSALSNLRLKNIPLRFDFPESHFDFFIEKTMLIRRSLVVLAGQVLLARSEIMLQAVMAELGDDGVNGWGGGGGVGGGGVLDGTGHVALVWPGRVELVGRAAVERMRVVEIGKRK